MGPFRGAGGVAKGRGSGAVPRSCLLRRGRGLGELGSRARMPKWGQNWGTDTEWRFSLRELADTENLARELKASEVVESLHVAAKGGCIDDGWLDLIIGALDVNESLKILNVNFHTHPSGWLNFCDALKRNKTLTVLNLGDHKFG